MTIKQMENNINRIQKTNDSSEEEVVDDAEAATSGEDEEGAEGEGAGNSDSEDGKEGDPEAYLSVGSLPDEHKPLGKKMLAAHTKAMAKLAEDKKKFVEEMGTKYARDVQRANLFGQITSLPAFENFWADVEAGKPYGFSSVYSKGKQDDDSSSDGDDEGSLTPAKVQKMVADAVSRATAPFHQEKSETEIKTIKEKYPSFDKHRPAVFKYISSNPGSSLEQALWAVAGDELTKEAVEKAIADLSRDSKALAGKKLHTEKPSSSTGEPATAGKKKTYNNVSDALRDAIAETLNK